MKKRWIRQAGGALAVLLALTSGVHAWSLSRASAGLAAAAAQTAVRRAMTAAEDQNDAVLTWDSLERRVRQGSLTAQSLQENIGSIQAMDYEKMTEDIRKQLNTLANQEFRLRSLGSSIPDMGVTDPASAAAMAMAQAAMQAQGTMAADSLHSAYDSLHDTFEDLKSGDLQQESADAVRQLENGVNQVVTGSQTLYLSVTTLERTLADGRRGLDTLDRKLQELRVRQEMGQVSQKTLQDLEQTRLETAAQLETLEATIDSLKLQLLALMGEKQDGELTLAPLPQLTDRLLDALDCEKDLEKAKEASWTLYSAKKTLDEAKDTWEDAKKDHSNPKSYQYQMAEHTWNAAQLTYEAAVQSFETSFRTQSRAIPGKRQAVASARSALELAQQQQKAVETQYAYGTASASAVQDAADSTAAARSALESAEQELFAAYQTYQNAVKYGILN